jgi:hypothetical protein
MPRFDEIKSGISLGIHVCGTGGDQKEAPQCIEIQPFHAHLMAAVRVHRMIRRELHRHTILVAVRQRL